MHAPVALCCTTASFILGHVLPCVQALLNAHQMHIATMALAIAILATLERTALKVSVLLVNITHLYFRCVRYRHS